MHKDWRHASWLSRWTRPRAPSLRDDPADYGTAFGLDMSFKPMDLDTPAAAPPTSASRVPAAGSWWSRWRQRAV